MMDRLGPIPTMKSVFDGHKNMCVEKEILDLLVNHLLYLFLNLCKLNISFYHPPFFLTWSLKKMLVSVLNTVLKK